MLVYIRTNDWEVLAIDFHRNTILDKSEDFAIFLNWMLFYDTLLFHVKIVTVQGILIQMV